jgi:hypothetical protein
MNKEVRVIVFCLAAFCAISLMWVSFEMCSISSFVVYHDSVQAEMYRSGYEREHLVAEAFHAAGKRLVAVEGAVAIVFLILLWRSLFGRYIAPDTPGS